MTNAKITDRFILIENCDEEEIIINDNKDFDDPTVSEDITEFKNKILLVRNCTNLKAIKADSLNLTGLVIDKCPQLEHLSVYNNRIKALKLDGLKNLRFVDINHNQVLENIYLAECENLQELYVSNNKLKDLDLTDNSKLRILYCSYNLLLEKLKVSHLEQLKTLHCESCNLKELDCNDLKNLEKLCCFDNGYYLEGTNNITKLKELNIEGCEALKILDCAENSLENYFLSNHPQLQTFSCKGNNISYLSIENCPNLQFLDFSAQCFSREIDNISKKLFYVGRKPTNLYVNSYSNLKTILYTEGANFSTPSLFLGSEPFTEFPNLKDFGTGTANDPAFEEYLDKKRQEEQRKNNFDEGYESDSKGNVSASNYKIPERKDEIVNHDLSQWNLTGKLIIDGWANLKSLNVGNNELNALVVRNCPKLKRLIYSHNKMPKEAEISGCNNLTTILNENYNGNIAWREELSEAEKTRLENLKKTAEYNDKVYLIFQREEQGESVDLDELTQIINKIDINLIDQEYKVKLLTLFNDKLKERFPQFYKKQPKKQENKPDYKKLYHDLLSKIKNGKITINNKHEITNSLLSKEKKEALYKLLAKQNTSQEQQPTNSDSFIISICLLSVVFLTLSFKILQDNIKSFLKKIIKTN